ncbi:CoB--CoM heterodisulfide reductase iron-sulfur subunit B family protein [Candidatus Bathyarchaeota archaeon]|nr:CoB--CoM heterodisulfide reductase iron-sulfur subunit B family protein [Candidatus Bathyarchaeota archaeon]
MRLAYYPGCTLKTNAKSFEISAIASAKVLGVELVELTRWNCCGTVHALAKDDVMHYIAPIRNLIRVEEMRDEGIVDENILVTLCEMCFNTLKRANTEVLKDGEKMRKVRENMEERDPAYRGEVEIKHFLEVVKDIGWNNISNLVIKKLKGLRIIPYYGCLLLRPRGLGIDDPDNPTILESLIKSLGGESVEIPFKSKCCGSYHTVHMEQVASELSHRILSQAAEAEADLIMLTCPLCSYNLGDRQEEIKKSFKGLRTIPVVYFTQLMALAFNLPAESTGFSENKPDPTVILKNKDLL